MSIILSGCGGGYDIFCSLPLYFKYKSEKQNVILVSLSFTRKSLLESLADKKQIKVICKHCYLVDPEIKMDVEGWEYFPEYYLSKILEQPIYVIHSDITINEITKSYNCIIEEANISQKPVNTYI